MSQSSSHATASGIGFVGLLTILFIGLKLTNVIEWSWVWVLAPVWISVIIWFIIFVTIVGLLIKFGR